MLSNKKFKKPNNVNKKYFSKKLFEKKATEEGKENKILVTPDSHCNMCAGRGRATIVTNSMPGMNVIMAGGCIRFTEFCSCVEAKAQKEAKRMKLVEGESFKIELTTEIKREDPLEVKDTKVVEPVLEEIK